MLARAQAEQVGQAWSHFLSGQVNAGFYDGGLVAHLPLLACAYKVGSTVLELQASCRLEDLGAIMAVVGKRGKISQKNNKRNVPCMLSADLSCMELDSACAIGRGRAEEWVPSRYHSTIGTLLP